MICKCNKCPNCKHRERRLKEIERNKQRTKIKLDALKANRRI